jgi:membrane-associated phospholipid phosphatase
MNANWVTTIVMALLISAAPVMAQTPQPPVPDPANTGQTKEVVPVPEGTGWATLIKDTGRDFASFPRRKSTWVLLAGGAAAALAAHPADDYVQSHIVGNETAERIFKAGQILGSAGFHVGSAVGLWVVGRYVVPSEGESRTNKVSHLGFDLLRAQIVAQALVQTIKVVGQRDRPTGECCAFPSGHAASAFAAASVLERHFGYRAWGPALVGASYVAASRLVDNRHFLSDVIFGAALGEAVGWTVVGDHGRSQFALQPVPVRGGMMIALVRTTE